MRKNSENDAARILVVDDDAVMREMVSDVLSERGFEVELASSGAEALDRLTEQSFACLLTDLQMPGMDGMALLGAMRERSPQTPALMMTSFGSIDTAVEAMRLGAHDFITKPFESDQLEMAIRRAVEKHTLEQENKRLRAAVDRVSAFGDLVGKSAAMNEIYALIRKISGNRSNILITGESGTGKEVVARTIHSSGARADKPFVPINCTAMPEGLLESELFGHVRGAFTGAQGAKKGLFEAASGGTLFLDEIGDMSQSLQGKLLRVIQDQEIRPVGGTTSIKVDVRLVTATNRDLRAEIDEGRFREDLYYRINVIPIHIPPLRERPDDVPPLAHFFAERLSGGKRSLSDGAVQKLQRAAWSGNARELENCIERSLALADGETVHAADVLISSDGPNAAGSFESGVLQLALEQRLSLNDLTDRYVEAVLEVTEGKKSEAARILGVNRRTLYRREERRASA